MILTSYPDSFELKTSQQFLWSKVLPQLESDNHPDELEQFLSSSVIYRLSLPTFHLSFLPEKVTKEGPSLCLSCP